VYLDEIRTTQELVIGAYTDVIVSGSVRAKSIVCRSATLRAGLDIIADRYLDAVYGKALAKHRIEAGGSIRAGDLYAGHTIEAGNYIDATNIEAGHGIASRDVISCLTLKTSEPIACTALRFKERLEVGGVLLQLHAPA
jgi:hypothetical protein